MFVGKISLDTQISRTLIGVYGRNGIGKTTSLLLLLLEQGTRVLYLSTETGFRVLQSTLKLIESLYKQALSGKTLDEIMDEFRLERPSLSKQMEEILICRVFFILF
jgi:predicted ATP-dependent serine protease